MMRAEKDILVEYVLKIKKVIEAENEDLEVKWTSWQFSENVFEVEVTMCRKMNSKNKYIRIKRDKELFCRNWGHLITANRVFDMAIDSGLKYLEQTKKEYTDELK